MSKLSKGIILFILSTLFSLPQFAYSEQIESVLTYTQDQAITGKSAYYRHCASCHGTELQGQGVSPALSGQNFRAKWKGQPASELLSKLRTMPPLLSNSLTKQNYSAIMAYMLQLNDIAPGQSELPSSINALAAADLPFDLATAAKTLSATENKRSSLLTRLRPIDAEMLNKPPPEDWLSWHRSNDSSGFSPLKQINVDTVNRLERVWRLPLPPGNNNPTPLIHDGVMFFYTFPDTVMAIDASNGELLWRYQHAPAVAASRKMGIALYGDKVFVPTSDMRMLALNAKTGALIWNKAIVTTVKMAGEYQRYDLRSAPIIAAGKVIIGVVGSVVPTGGFIVALDAQSGEETWRFNTIARPGEPWGNSWNGLPLDKRSGGSVWIPGSYDPALNLVYFGVAPTYDTQPLRHSVNREGITNDALYTNSTIALNPDSGELIWHYQHLANDQWDLDWAFERQIIEIPFRGQTRKAVINVGKLAILDALDAKSGEYLFSIDMGLQNIVSSIDPLTGAKKLNPQTLPRTIDSYVICPTASGARSWPPTAYNPITQRLYLPLSEGCYKAGPKGSPLLMTGINISYKTFADSADGNIGRLQVVDLKTQSLAWSHRQQTPLVSSILATGGGLIFSGDLVPSLKAFDEANGRLLWQATLDDSPSSSIVTYGVNGRQYIAVVVGQSNNHVRDWSNMSKAFAKIEAWQRPVPPEGEGPSIWVFALQR